MASSYGKKSLKDSFNSAVRKVVATVMLLGAGAAPLYYEYGTVKEQDVKVTAYHDNHEYNYDTHKYEGSGYTLETDKGSFVVESSKWHLQSDEDAGKIYKQMTPSYSYFYSSSNDETYRIKTYGFHLAGSFQPNIIAAREISDKELQAQAAAEHRADSLAQLATNPPTLSKPANTTQQQNTQTTTQQKNTQQPTSTDQQTATQSGLSGDVKTIDVFTDDGTRVRMTVPVEVGSDDIIIKSVTPPAAHKTKLKNNNP